MEHPHWALKYKRKGTELRFINGRYYLYEVASRWNPEKKRAQKITGKLLGRITEERFIPSKRYGGVKEKIHSVTAKEYGATKFILDTFSNINEALKAIFPSIYREIIIVAVMRMLYSSPIKNIGFRFQHSYLSVLYNDVTITDKRVSNLLRELGSCREKIREFFKKYIINTNDEHILIDATHIFSDSNGIEEAKTGYNSKKVFDPQINLLFIYSITTNLPIYYRIVAGNIREIKAFKLTLKESGINDAVVITDKGFYSTNNIELLRNENISFIIPLRRNSKLIDYNNMQKKDFQEYFKYNNRYIWYRRYNIPEGFVYCYLDEQLKTKEEYDYLNRVETLPDEYSIESFYEKQDKFGTLALLTDIDETAEDIYMKYKSRNNIEVMFDAMKNILNCDNTYMRNTESLEGWMFIAFIILQWYYCIYNLLFKKNLLSKYSPMDLLMHLAEIKKVKINNIWYTAEITEKTNKLLNNIELHIT